MSLVYRGLVALRRWLYARGIFESARLPVPVVVVGNVVAGGAGKHFVRAGGILVNGIEDLRPGRKLHTGDVVKVAGVEHKITV